jgi:hypothetical protein
VALLALVHQEWGYNMTWKELAQDYSNLCAKIGNIVVEQTMIRSSADNGSSRMVTPEEKNYLRLQKDKMKLIEDACIILELLRERK